jgi:hypothetical protein
LLLLLLLRAREQHVAVRALRRCTHRLAREQHCACKHLFLAREQQLPLCAAGAEGRGRLQVPVHLDSGRVRVRVSARPPGQRKG